MDVDKIAFPSRLLEILEVLSECTFCSIDFEFSGVSSKPTSRSKQTLKERYAETAASASRYTILQVGLTTATWDVETSKYVLKPWNFPLGPTFEEDLDLERQWSMQSGAMEFLLKNGFNFNVSFEDGVPYLSREEEEVAKQKFRARNDKDRFEDMEIAEGDEVTKRFMTKVRGEVEELLKKGTMDEVEILSRTLHWKEKRQEENGGDLTGFDKRLIHQLVRNEYPQLVTIGRRQSILIKHMDEEREHQVRKDKYKRLKKKIYWQTGFRWVIEALTRGPLHNIDLMWFARDHETGAPRYYESIPFEARFNRAVDKLKRQSPVLVGHNCFTDLIYLYATFIGKLPETVEEYRIRIHDLFPVVVDTKYMFTHNCGNMNPMSSLDSIEEDLRVQRMPKIQTHKEHRKYEDEEMYHEAGYDSYLTARVMILLSAKLEAKGTYVPESGVNTPTIGSPAKVRDEEVKEVKVSPPRPASRFATKTLFEALADGDINGVEEQDLLGAAVGSGFALNPRAGTFRMTMAGADGAAESASSMSAKDHPKRKEKSNEPKLDSQMPPFDSDFWRVYANKLRVFGTHEGLLDLDPTRMK